MNSYCGFCARGPMPPYDSVVYGKLAYHARCLKRLRDGLLTETLASKKVQRRPCALKLERTCLAFVYSNEADACEPCRQNQAMNHPEKSRLPIGASE